MNFDREIIRATIFWLAVWFGGAMFMMHIYQVDTKRARIRELEKVKSAIKRDNITEAEWRIEVLRSLERIEKRLEAK